VGTSRSVPRRLNNLTKTYPSVVAALSAVRAASAIIDGEIVAVDASGRPNFQALQNARTATVVFYAFDLLHLNGRDLTAAPIEQRRADLQRVIAGTRLLLSETLPGTPAEIERAIRRLGLEGVVAKRRGSTYVPGTRSQHWLKVRFNRRQEFVVGGYRPIDHDFDALLVGYYEGTKLLFAAKVRAGFKPAMRADILKRLGPPISRCPFADLPREAAAGGAKASRSKTWRRCDG
jgi:bifunctional non-homologous end joining protein LigD